MSKNYIYPEDIVKSLHENEKYIPRHLKPNEYLKLFHRYWSPENNCYFKVESIFDEQDTIYYTVRFLITGHYGVITYPLNSDYCYEILTDKNNIIDQPILNNQCYYSGAEIKYWFFRKDLLIKYPDKYSVFRPYICYAGKSELQDDKYYKIVTEYDEEKNVYIKCKFITNKNISR